MAIMYRHESVVDLIVLAQLIAEDHYRYNYYEFSDDFMTVTFSYHRNGHSIRHITYAIAACDSIPDAIDNILDTIYA